MMGGSKVSETKFLHQALDICSQIEASGQPILSLRAGFHLDCKNQAPECLIRTVIGDCRRCHSPGRIMKVWSGFENVDGRQFIVPKGPKD